MLRLIFTSGLYGVAEVLARAFQTIALFWLARVCTKPQYGRIGLLISVQQIIAMVVVGGLVESTITMLNEYRGQGRLSDLFHHARRCLFATAALVILLYALLYPLVFRWYLAGIPVLLQLTAGAVGAMLGYFTLMTALHQFDEKHAVAVLFKFIPIAACYFAGFIGAWLSLDKIWGFFFGCAAGLIITNIAAQAFLPKVNHGAVYDRPLFRALIWGAAPLLPVVLVHWLLLYGTNFAILHFFSSSEVAEFTLVLALNSALLLAVNSVNQVWSPRFFKLAQTCSDDQLHRLNGAVNTGAMWLTATAAGGLLVLFSPIIHLVGGNMRSYGVIRPYLLLTFASYVFLSLYYRSFNFYLKNRQQGAFMRIFVVTGIIGFTASCLLMWRVGVWGIYVGFLLGMTLRAVATFVYARRRWGVSLTYAEIPVGLAVLAAGYVIGDRSTLLLRIVYFSIVAGTAALLAWLLHRRVITTGAFSPLVSPEAELEQTIVEASR